MLKNLNLLLELQKLDITIKKIETEKQQIPLTLNTYQEKIESQKQIFEDTKKNLTDKQLEKKDLELELATIEENIKKHNIELNSVKSNEKYSAILEIIKHEKQKKSDLEDKILLDFDDLDNFNIEITKEKENIQKAEQDFAMQKQELDKKIQELEIEIKNNLEKRTELVNKIDDKNLLAMYENIRSHQKGIGLAEADIETASCKSCNVSLTLQKINDIISSDQPILCENCSKILYIVKKD
jgi:predicted  nucleic acid-binding Zn-ribbon protein